MVDSYQITNILTEQQVAEEGQIVRQGRQRAQTVMLTPKQRPKVNPMMISSRARQKHQDTGLFWDEPLGLYLDGTININLYNNVLGFMSGDTIAGTIDIEIGQPFEAQNLLLEFNGQERCHIGGATDIEDYHREVKEIISMKQVVVQFPPDQ